MYEIAVGSSWWTALFLVQVVFMISIVIGVLFKRRTMTYGCEVISQDRHVGLFFS